MPGYGTFADAMRKAWTLDPADTDLAYVISVMERIRSAHAPR
jgi:hypothetical protein